MSDGLAVAGAQGAERTKPKGQPCSAKTPACISTARVRPMPPWSVPRYAISQSGMIQLNARLSFSGVH